MNINQNVLVLEFKSHNQKHLGEVYMDRYDYVK